MKFKIGDIIKGTSGAPYGITTDAMTEGRVIKAEGNSIRVVVLEHADSSYRGHNYEVDPKYFEFVRREEPIAKEKIGAILEQHRKWLQSEEGGERAVLRDADLRGADLRGAVLSRAVLRGADLSRADLSRAVLRDADLSRAVLRDADLRGADLSDADLSRAVLRDADLSRADLSRAEGLQSTIDFMEMYFERADKGYIAYKTFGHYHSAPDKWDIKEGAVIEEVVNFTRTSDCGCGINVAPLDWVKRHGGNSTIWKVLIEWPWLTGVCVPYNSDGKIRCERVRLIETLG